MSILASILFRCPCLFLTLRKICNRSHVSFLLPFREKSLAINEDSNELIWSEKTQTTGRLQRDIYLWNSRFWDVQLTQWQLNIDLRSSK